MSLTSYHCSTPQFFKKTFHCSTCSWFRFQGNSLCPGLLVCAHYYTPGGRGLSWIACIRNNSRHVPAFILYPGRNVLFIYLKGLRPLCRHPVTNRLRMRGIYCSLNPLYLSKNLFWRCVRDSNPWTPPWQGGMITDFTNAPNLSRLFCLGGTPQLLNIWDR